VKQIDFIKETNKSEMENIIKSYEKQIETHNNVNSKLNENNQEMN